MIQRILVLTLLTSIQAHGASQEFAALERLQQTIEEEPSDLELYTSIALDMIPMVSFIPELIHCTGEHVTPCLDSHPVNFVFQNVLGVIPQLVTVSNLGDTTPSSLAYYYPAGVASSTLEVRKYRAKVARKKARARRVGR